jgi:putative DNA primase/helicase
VADANPHRRGSRTRLSYETGGGRVQRAARAGQAALPWQSALAIDAAPASRGVIRQVLVNASIALHYAPEWQDVFALNLFTDSIRLLKRPPYLRAEQEFTPRELMDEDIIRTTTWLHQQEIYVSEQIAHSAIQEVAAANAWHPVRAYLDSLTWDKEPRVDTWLIDHLGVEDSPLHRAYGARFLISAIAACGVQAPRLIRCRYSKADRAC